MARTADQTSTSGGPTMRCEACQEVTDAGKPTTCPECPSRRLDEASVEKVRLDVVQYVLGLLPSGSDWKARAVYLAFEIAGNRDADHICDAFERLEAAQPGFVRRVEDFARDIGADDAATYLATLSEMNPPECSDG